MVHAGIIPLDLQEQMLPVMEACGGPPPSAHCVVGGDTSETVVLGIFTPGRHLAARTRAALDAFGAHAGGALRLRRLLGRVPDADSAHAVLSPDGKVLDARSATARDSLASLVDAARRTERARSRRASHEERLALWTALFDGQWSIVARTDTDGKRLLLACRNPPRTAEMRRLTARQRSVAQYAAFGHTQKYIAYELGISPTSVSLELRCALRKLGLRSRADLIQLFAAMPAGTTEKDVPHHDP